MIAPDISQIITLSDGSRAMIYRVALEFKALPYLPAMWRCSVVTADGQRHEVYL